MVLTCSSLKVGGAGFKVSVSLDMEKANVPVNIAENIRNSGIFSLLSSLCSVLSLVTESVGIKAGRQFKHSNLDAKAYFLEFCLFLFLRQYLSV